MNLKQSILLSLIVAIASSADLFATPNDPAPRPPTGPRPNPSVLTNLVFDAEVKQRDVKPDDLSAAFTFSVTNAWTNEITVVRVKTSCGCTVASLPSEPWHIPPGGHGEVKAKVDLLGKPPGLIAKTLTFFLSVNGFDTGTRIVTLKVVIPAGLPESPPPLSAAGRKAALEKARAEPQRIFKDPGCAECHVNQGMHLLGAALYAADCGICHDSPNRASSVPDLRTLKLPAGAEYWKRLIANGKTNSMMPPFAIRRGGPLSDEQVSSLAAYLSRASPPSSPAKQ